MIDWRVNFIGMNLRRTFSFWKTRCISRFQLLPSIDGIKSVAAVHVTVWMLCVMQCGSCSLSVCELPSQECCSLPQSTHLNFPLSWPKPHRSGVRNMKRGSEFSCIPCPAFQLSYRRTVVSCGECFSCPMNWSQMIFPLWADTFLLTLMRLTWGRESSMSVPYPCYDLCSDLSMYNYINL